METNKDYLFFKATSLGFKIVIILAYVTNE